MSLWDALAEDVLDILADEFGPAESITYIVAGGGVVGPLKALIRRLEPDIPKETNTHRTRRAYVWIANDATSGIVAPKVGDSVQMELKVGAGTVTARVNDITLSNAAAHRLQVVG